MSNLGQFFQANPLLMLLDPFSFLILQVVKIWPEKKRHWLGGFGIMEFLLCRVVDTNTRE